MEKVMHVDAYGNGLLPSTPRYRLRRGLLLSSLLCCLLGAASAVHAGSVTYAYDTLGRLTSLTYSNGVVITYTYDAAGNRSSVVTTGV